MLVQPGYDARPDAAIYISTARSLAAGEGYTYLGTPFRNRPPGFALLISPFVGDGVPDFHTLNLVVSLFGVAAVAFLYLQQRPRVGSLLAFFTASALWLNAGYQRLCNSIMSDVPGLALILLCLLVERWASRSPTLRREIGLGLAIGAAAYVRSIALLLVPAILLSRLWRQRAEAGRAGGSFVVRRLVVFAALGGLLVLPWAVRNERNSPPPPVDQIRNYSLATAMWHRDPGDPNSPRFGFVEVLARPLRRGPALANVLGSRMLAESRILGARAMEELQPPSAVVTALLLASLVVVLVRRREPAEIFALGVAAILAFYFDFVDRLVLPVYVIGFAASVEVAENLAERALGPHGARFAVCAGLGLLIAFDLGPLPNRSSIEETHRVFSEIATAVGPRLAPDARLGSHRGYLYSVYLDRPVYNLTYAVHRAGRDDAVEEIIDKYALDTIVLTPRLSGDRNLIPYFEKHYGVGERVAEARLWRVRP